jgi:hypothetical protein
MPGEDLTPPSAELSVFGNLWSGIVDAAGVTDFGDQAIVLPLTVGTAVIFALSGWRRGALAWTATIGGTLGLILLLKLRFLACGHFPPGTGPGNPSGHTAAAAAVYGGLVAIVCDRYGPISAGQFRALSPSPPSLLLSLARHD